MSEGSKVIDRFAAPEDTWPLKETSGQTSGYGYSVEARAADYEPANIAGQLFDLRWKRVKFQEVPPDLGVPSSNCIAHRHHLLDYAQAEALRWWFVAQANAQRGMGFSIETRIVKHAIRESYSVEAVSASDPMKRPI